VLTHALSIRCGPSEAVQAVAAEIGKGESFVDKNDEIRGNTLKVLKALKYIERCVR
jgi:hypothetical protein